MNDPQLNYFNQEDTLHILLSEEEEMDSMELTPNVTAELNKQGELIGIEILKASEFLKDFIVQMASEKNLKISKG